MNPITWAASVAAIKRGFKPAVIAILVGLAVWFAFQSQRLAADNAALAKVAKAEAAKRREAEKANTAMFRAVQEAELASAAAMVRAQTLTAAVERQKGTIDALEAKYGATRVSDLTRAHLQWLREHQRP